MIGKTDFRKTEKVTVLDFGFGIDTACRELIKVPGPLESPKGELKSQEIATLQV